MEPNMSSLGPSDHTAIFRCSKVSMQSYGTVSQTNLTIFCRQLWQATTDCQLTFDLHPLVMPLPHLYLTTVL